MHDQLSPGLRHYTKFLVVRHPLDRLLSAYYNIVHKSSNGLGPGPAVIRALELKYKTQRSKLTLTQFVDFLTSTKPVPASVLYDRHYDTFAHACDVCNIHYDYVIRHETMGDDATEVLNMLGFPADYFRHAEKVHPGTRRSYTLGLGEKYLYEYNNVPRSKLKKLLRRYQVDMNVFGYGFDEDLKITSCEINVSRNVTCC